MHNRDNTSRCWVGSRQDDGTQIKAKLIVGNSTPCEQSVPGPGVVSPKQYLPDKRCHRPHGNVPVPRAGTRTQVQEIYCTMPLRTSTSRLGRGTPGSLTCMSVRGPGNSKHIAAWLTYARTSLDVAPPTPVR